MNAQAFEAFAVRIEQFFYGCLFFSFMGLISSIYKMSRHLQMHIAVNMLVGSYTKVQTRLFIHPFVLTFGTAFLEYVRSCCNTVQLINEIKIQKLWFARTNVFLIDCHFLLLE